MLFSSPTFFVFFLAYFACHLLIPRAYRNYLIIVGSTIFYSMIPYHNNCLMEQAVYSNQHQT